MKGNEKHPRTDLRGKPKTESLRVLYNRTQLNPV
jgi:hypothetical protein